MIRNTIRFAAAIMILAAAVSCGQKYSVSGTFTGGQGKTVVLQKQLPDTLVTFAEAVVGEDGKFSFRGELDHPQRVTFSYNDGKKKQVFLGTEPVRIVLDSVTVTAKDGSLRKQFECKVYGGKEQDVLQNGIDLNLSNSLLQLGSMFALSKALETGDKVYIDSVQTGLEMMKANFAEQLKMYVDTTRDCQASTYFIKEFMLINNPIGDVRSAYDSLDAKVKASVLGQELLSAIEKAALGTVGGIPDNFTLPDQNGKDFSLYDLRGHYVILDFWASWCKPCLGEMPNVKEIYKKHHADGLEILGVSLDDNGDNWRKAIDKYDLDWHHVSSLQGWTCPVAKTFNVTGIPRMFILDPTGKIIAMDLRGEELAKTIDELFK